MNLDTRSPVAAVIITNLLENRKYKELEEGLKQQTIIGDCSDFQGLLDLIAKTITQNFSTENNIARDELLDFCLRKLVSERLLSYWKVQLLCLQSHRLAKIIVDVLCDRWDELDKESEVWNYLMYEGALRKETALVKQIEKEQGPLRYFVECFEQILRFYSHPEANHLKFDRILFAIFKKFPPNSIEISELLIILERKAPFHPYIVAATNSFLMKSVYSPLYMAYNIGESLYDYISTTDENREFVNINVIIACLNNILRISNNYPEEFTELFEKLIYELFHYTEKFENNPDRTELVNKVSQLISVCSPRSRVLILKVIADKLKRARENFDLPASQLGYVVDMYRKSLNEVIFKEELGSFFAILEKIHYDDMDLAQPFYSAVIILYHQLLLYGLNLGMAKEIRDRIINPIRNQLGDYLEVQRLRKQNASADEFTLNSIELPSSTELILFHLTDVYNLFETKWAAQS